MSRRNYNNKSYKEETATEDVAAVDTPIDDAVEVVNEEVTESAEPATVIEAAVEEATAPVEEEIAEAIEETTTPEAEVEEPKTEEPVVEEKKTVKKAVAKKAATTAKKAEKPVSAAVAKYNTIATRYLEIMTKQNKAAEDQQAAVITLMNMANHVLLSQDNGVFDACFRFMLKNRSIMLAPSIVTKQFTKYVTPKSKITKLVQFYVAFQSLVESKLMNTRFTLNVTTLRRTFNNDALANWFIVNRSQ